MDTSKISSVDEKYIIKKHSLQVEIQNDKEVAQELEMKV